MINGNVKAVFVGLVIGFSCSTFYVSAMTEGASELPQISMIIDAPIELEPLFPRIGHYATPYAYGTPLVAISSSTLIDVMPENMIRAVGGIYTLAGSLDAIRAGLKKQQKERALQTSLVIWSGLSTNPTHYNVVFHQILGNWLNLKEAQSFNVTIPAGLFATQGVKAGAESIAFDALGGLNVNRHDVLFYSPDNGRFYPEPSKDVVSFWVVGTHGGRTVVSYNLMLLSTNAKKLFTDMVEIAQAVDEAERLSVLIQGLQNLEKVIKKEDQGALAGVMQALERMQIAQLPVVVPAKRAPAKKPASSGPLVLSLSKGPAKKLSEIKREAAVTVVPARPVFERKRNRAASQEARDAALAADLAAQSLFESEQIAATEALLAREAQSAEDEAAVAALVAGELPA